MVMHQLPLAVLLKILSWEWDKEVGDPTPAVLLHSPLLLQHTKNVTTIRI